MSEFLLNQLIFKQILGQPRVEQSKSDIFENHNRLDGILVLNDGKDIQTNNVLKLGMQLSKDTPAYVSLHQLYKFCFVGGDDH